MCRGALSGFADKFCRPNEVSWLPHQPSDQPNLDEVMLGSLKPLCKSLLDPRDSLKPLCNSSVNRRASVV
eukprot:1356919-Prymnesium_polylepis.2